MSAKVEGVVTARGRLALEGARALLASLPVAAGLFLSGCMVGPAYVRPAVSTEAAWLESNDPSIRAEPAQTARWWEVFADPTLVRLVETAYAENLTLRSAGLRVVEAQARRAIAIGTLFPQQQALVGSYSYTIESLNTVQGQLVSPRGFDTFRAGFDAAWEIDLWGKFRRAVEAADSDLLAAVASYDDVLVSLVSEVAATYLTIRTLDERLAVARDNVRVQDDSLGIARVRYEAGGTSELDVQQAATLLHDTEATIPELERLRRQAIDSLCVLLGMPPQELAELLGGPGILPEVPVSVAVGVPADLLRRRPDVRSAEFAAAAQSARIGVATAQLLPAFQLTGTVGLSAEQAAEWFEGRSFEALAGPSFNWPVLNYGRLINDVRLQDATFQELATAYSNVVLVAQQEVEDALVGYLRGTERVQRLAEAVEAAHRAVDLSLIQYRGGATDYTAVLNSQQAKLREDDELVNERGIVALSVVALYKALGGGWELREGQDFVPAETREQMQARTRWGGLLSQKAQAQDVDKAESDTQKHAWWQWRWWWPKW
ncbi:MAG TPA: efflux transporter outer membrane subunit [Myxococcota bacterium]|nr:efflux transporter outer membrane subunit [Myxococcota bacterium]